MILKIRSHGFDYVLKIFCKFLQEFHEISSKIFQKNYKISEYFLLFFFSINQSGFSQNFHQVLFVISTILTKNFHKFYPKFS